MGLFDMFKKKPAPVPTPEPVPEPKPEPKDEKAEKPLPVSRLMILRLLVLRTMRKAS